MLRRGQIPFVLLGLFICVPFTYGEDSNSPYKERLAKLRRAKTIVFLGDSITYVGQYVSLFDAWLAEQGMENEPTVINVGLSSETVSGLSEEGHAGGRFPRPDLAERLDRVLALTKPDLVFACYGINCGIYKPFDEKRFMAYQQGIRRLRKKVKAQGAELVLITPPTFDDARKSNDFSYNGVLDKYSDWLVEQQQNGWAVIDLHTAMSRALAEAKRSDPAFTFQPDAVHPSSRGHEFIARFLIQWFGGKTAQIPMDKELLKATSERMQLLRNAYLYKAGHKRPGVKAGLPIPKAKARADVLTEAIRNRID